MTLAVVAALAAVAGCATSAPAASWNGSPARPPGRAGPAATSSSAATKGSPPPCWRRPRPAGPGG